MPVKRRIPGVKPLAPIKDISAKIPPSPRLSARMTNRQYLIETVTIKVQNTSESTPSAVCGVNWPAVACTTICRVYKGLVPKSPNTTPSAPKAAQDLGCAGCASLIIFRHSSAVAPAGQTYPGPRPAPTPHRRSAGTMRSVYRARSTPNANKLNSVASPRDPPPPPPELGGGATAVTGSGPEGAGGAPGLFGRRRG